MAHLLDPAEGCLISLPVKITEMLSPSLHNSHQLPSDPRHSFSYSILRTRKMPVRGILRNNGITGNKRERLFNHRHPAVIRCPNKVTPNENGGIYFSGFSHFMSRRFRFRETVHDTEWDFNRANGRRISHIYFEFYFTADTTMPI